MYECFFYMYIFVSCVCSLPVEVRKEHQIPCGIAGGCETPLRFWGLSLAPPDEQAVLLTTESSP